MYAIELTGNITTGYEGHPDVPQLAPVSIVLTERYATEDEARLSIDRMVSANHSKINKRVVEVS